MLDRINRVTTWQCYLSVSIYGLAHVVTARPGLRKQIALYILNGGRIGRTPVNRRGRVVGIQQAAANCSCISVRSGIASTPGPLNNPFPLVGAWLETINAVIG